MKVEELFLNNDLPLRRLPGQITANDLEEFKENYKAFFKQDKARNAKRVVYVWSTDAPIRRLKGESPILYIGKTIQSLTKRNRLYNNNNESKEDAWERYKHIIDDYGPISVFYTEHKDPGTIEKEFLKDYLKCHLEDPPMNRQSR